MISVFTGPRAKSICRGTNTAPSGWRICLRQHQPNEATQAMLIKGDNRMSTLATCLAAAPDYHLKEGEAAALIEAQIAAVAANWDEICKQAELSPVDRKLFAGRQFLNSFCLQGLDGYKALQDAFHAGRETLITSGDA